MWLNKTLQKFYSDVEGVDVGVKEKVTDIN